MDKFHGGSTSRFHSWFIIVFDLSEGLSTNAKLFLDDTSLFFVIYDKQTSANELSNDLEMIHNWVFNGK